MFTTDYVELPFPAAGRKLEWENSGWGAFKMVPGVQAEAKPATGA